VYLIGLCVIGVSKGASDFIPLNAKAVSMSAAQQVVCGWEGAALRYHIEQGMFVAQQVVC